MNLPETWAEAPLSSIVQDVQPGFAQSPGAEDAGTMPQIRTHNVSPDGRIMLDGIKHVTPSPAELEKYLLAPGDVIFNNTNSEEWVGKTAVFQEPGQYVFSNHMTRLRVRSNLIDAEYLANYLHFLWLQGYSRNRAKRWVSQAAVDVSTLLNFNIVLPTLAEQIRTLDTLRQFDSLLKHHGAAKAIECEIHSTLFEQFFQSTYWSQWPVEPFGNHVTYSRYGPRFPNASYSDSGVHILRTTDMDDDGTIRWWEAPQLTLSEDEIKEYALKPGTLLLSRSGTIGPAAIFEGADAPCVAGAYLLEFGLAPTLHPEYVRALFRTQYVQAHLKKAVRSVAVPNINAPSVKAIPIPVPPLHVQEEFVSYITELRNNSTTRRVAGQQLTLLRAEIVAAAFTGELTATWREAHKNELLQADARRRPLLGAAPRAGVRFTERAPRARPGVGQRPARRWLLGQLSDFQDRVWQAVESYESTVIPGNDESFEDFCDRQWEIEQDVAEKDHIGRALTQLAALGLIARISLRNDRGEFVTAYRRLRDGEETRLADIERLQARLKSSEAAS